MPTKKGKKKTTHHRRHHVGKIGTDSISTALGAAVGGAGGWYIYTTQKTIQDSLMGALQLGLGFALMTFVKNPIAKGAGAGLLASGGIILGESFGVLSGVTNLPAAPGSLKIAGYESVKQLGAVPGRTFPQPSMVGRVSARKFAGSMMR